MIKRMLIMLILCGLVFGGIFGFKAFGNKMMMAYFAEMGSTPQTISTTIAVKKEWKPTLRAVGTLRAAQGADIAPEVSGTVEHVFIESGQDVTAGTILLQLSSQEELARLKSLEAQTKLATITLNRDEKQLAVEAISQATYDADKAQLDSLTAQLDEQKALLQKKVIIAPFSGRLGIRKVDVGQYLTAGTPIVTLQQLDPIYLDFFIPQQKVGVIKVGQKIVLSSDSVSGQTFTGKITAMNAKVNETTRNIEVRAIFENPEKTLRPGMFATANIEAGTVENFITLPQTAVTFNPYGNTVFIVQKKGTNKDGTAKNTVKTAFVETGKTRGDQIAILSGINAGDEIVTAGQLKIRNGSSVTINNALQPSNDADPTLTDK